MEPPPCVQNAMLTKDKKPFTYTPGGIDLSEARSPRLQRRIERNAHLGGVSDVPQHPSPHPPITGPLPPSALAAMRPQPQVQVFPSGPAPPAPIRGGIPPPPPPPQHGIPPPPPPPSCPLPTQKVQTSDNQVLERPDMTKIIPENPMSMLRKTGGPQPRKSLVDQIFEDVGKHSSEPKSPSVQAQQQRIQPGGAPISPVPQQTYIPPQQQKYQQQAQQQYQPSVQQNAPAREQYHQPSYKEDQSRYQPPVVERQAVPSQNNGSQEVKTSTAHLGSLYIPPVTQQQQKRIVSPPTPPERNQESTSLQTPPLREAPRPWQTKKPQEEAPVWTKRDNQISNNVEEPMVPRTVSQPQQIWSQPPARHIEQSLINQQQYEHPKQNQQIHGNRQDTRQHQQPIGIRIDIRTKPQPSSQDQSEVDNKSNVVYVTQPMVLRHPGPASQNQLNNQVPSTQVGSRVIPVQIEGSVRGGNERVLNRQQSNPSQSNSFKILQKFTNTDGEDEYENIPITEHSPKFPQHFQQPVDQMRRMKVSDGDQQITNTFKQVSHIPQTPQSKGPQVRTIPIQIEGDDTPGPYVHPSEQVVSEPKKYTGSSIPSRSFKILQAMTSPNNYANVEEQSEEIPWIYPSHYPPYAYPPYWYDYYRYCNPDFYSKEDSPKKSTPRSGVSRSASPSSLGRHVPLPFWGFAPPYYFPPKSSDSGTDTPKPIPPHCYNYDSYYPSEVESGETTDENNDPQEYLPYYDPYYYHYYYGYPPMYPSYPTRHVPSDTDSTLNGYSSVDEQVPHGKKNQGNSIKKTSQDEKEMNKMIPTLTINEVITTISTNEDKIESTTDCESDTETDEEYSNHLQGNALQSMKSITNMNFLNVESSDEETSKEDMQVEEFSDASNDDIDDRSSMYFDEEPHQLSVIIEESERTESRLRSVSVLSDSTTLAERSDEEDDIVGDNKTLDTKTNEIYENIIINKTFDDNCQHTDGVKEEIDNAEDDKNSNESEDWWGIIGKEDDDLPKAKKTPIFSYTASIDEEIKYNNNADCETDIVNEIKAKTPTLEIAKFKHESNVSDSNIVIDTLRNQTVDHTESDNDDKETNISTDNTDRNDLKVIRRLKSTNIEISSEQTNINVSKSRPRSIYESLEDIQAESTGSLIQVDNFVGILEKIKEDSGFWNLDIKSSKNKPVIQFRRTKSVEEKSNVDIEKRFTWTSFENFNRDTCNICADEETEIETKNKRFSCGSLEDYTINIKTKETNNGSTNYIKYNSSLSSTPVFENKNINLGVPVIIDDNSFDTKSSTNESQTEESCDSSDSSLSEKDEKENSENLVRLTEETDIKIPTIKDRIQALRESINAKRKVAEQDPKPNCKDKISTTDLMSRSKTASSKSSLKSFEELSEEEVDSGVTSDMSRHISDNEEFPELKKLTKYQRAATHSRLFKLLQEECNNEDIANEDDKHAHRQNLNLSLDKTADNQVPVNERLVNELIDSLLKLKKGQAFKNVPKEKLYAAAVKILQEDTEIAEIPSEDFSSFLSPIRPSTGYSTAVQTPQEFGGSFDDYKQYYESWNKCEENYDVFPSKAFKILQEMPCTNKQTGGLGSSIKCPKVLSSRNVHKKLIKLLESSENSSNPIPDKPPLDTNEVTSVS